MNIDDSKKAIIAMSGGVDSSVAAYLMKEKGYECMGVTMKLYTNEEICIKNEKTCCSLDDVEDARNVANVLDIPYYVFNFKDKFEEKIIKRFIDVYLQGGTPNPCVDCNKYIKFDKLMDRMYELDYDYVVTGHYARIEYENGRYLLKKGLDESKDQSYVLYNMTQEQLKHTIFPLGQFEKTEIREIAEKQGFVNARKHDSQDICFVPDGDYSRFIENYCGKKFEAGDFVDKDGNVLGRHGGIPKYTIGQRKGLGIAFGKPMYVCEKDMDKNEVVLGAEEDLYSKELDATDINLISVEKIEDKLRCKARIRYKQKEDWAWVYQKDDNNIHIVFDEPQRGVSKGQAVVLYDGDIVVGGGTIA